MALDHFRSFLARFRLFLLVPLFSKYQLLTRWLILLSIFTFENQPFDYKRHKIKYFGWLSEFYATLLIWYWRKFGCKFETHRIRVTIDNLETGELLFETNMKLCNMRFKMIKIWEGLASHKKSHNERLLLKNLSERVLFNKLHECLYTAKIYSSEFGCLRAKKIKRFIIFTNLRWKNLCIYI